MCSSVGKGEGTEPRATVGMPVTDYELRVMSNAPATGIDDDGEIVRSEGPNLGGAGRWRLSEYDETRGNRSDNHSDI